MSQAFWDVASVSVRIGQSSGAAHPSGDDENDDQEDSVANNTDDSVSFEVDGKNIMVDDEPYMNLVQLLVVDEAGVGLKGAKITIGSPLPPTSGFFL